MGVGLHRLPAIGSIEPIVLPAERHATLVGGDQSLVGDSDAMCVARQVAPSKPAKEFFHETCDRSTVACHCSGAPVRSRCCGQANSPAVGGNAILGARRDENDAPVNYLLQRTESVSGFCLCATHAQIGGRSHLPTVAWSVPLHKDGTRRDDRQPVPVAAASRCGTPVARRHTADATDSRPAARAGSAPRPSAGCARVWLQPPCPAPAPTTKAPACRDAAGRRRGAP